MTIVLLGWQIGLWCITPVRAFPFAPPRETLAGLTPGISTLADASRLYGVYDVVLTGEYAPYIGGPRATRDYRWTTTGITGKVPGLIVETPIGSPRIDYIVVDEYPGLGTSTGLTTLMPETQVLDCYGYPDYAYDLEFDGGNTHFHELFYLNQGLLVVLGQVQGRTNFTVTKLVLTYPTYLRNAVALRNRYASAGLVVEDITESYRAWVSMISSQ